jgi:hypothetical protein
MAKKKLRGLGDVVKAVTDFVGVVPCEACEKRQARWNKLYPLTKKPRELTAIELENWRAFRLSRKNELSNEQRLFVCRIYADVFRQLYFEPCINCSPAPYVYMIESMDLIFADYENS